MRRFQIIISAELTVPDGSEVVENTNGNQIKLPDGSVISVYPIVERRSSVDSDDDCDLNTRQCSDLGIGLEYDRSTE